MTAIWIEVVGTRGSAPRDAGTAMKVTLSQIEGTIGGGALEHRAIAQARKMLMHKQTAYEETVPLGPGLGQCCGGAVRLRYGGVEKPVDKQDSSSIYNCYTIESKVPLWLWGAGHVGRAVVAAAPSDAFDITWVDDGPERFPANASEAVTVLPTPDMARLARHADTAAHHLIFTYSHDIDLALCAALLDRGAQHIGLIGSATKWARFSARLRAMGLEPARITCPIGDKSLGKAPAQIANGVVRTLLSAHAKAIA